MTAPAPRRRTSGSASGVSRAALFIAGTLLGSSHAAAAQLGAVVSVYSDLRFRGYSLSDARPVAIVDLSYDAPSGVYGALSGSVVAARGEGPRPLGITLNGGYSTRIGPGLSADAGVIHSRYSHYSDLASGRSYSEVYAGLAGKSVGVRLSISPNYIGTADWTLHAEVSGHADLDSRLFLDGALGILVPLEGRGYRGAALPEWDARLGLARRLGPISLHVAATARGSSADVYAGRRHGRTALILGVSTAL